MRHSPFCRRIESKPFPMQVSMLTVHFEFNSSAAAAPRSEGRRAVCGCSAFLDADGPLTGQRGKCLWGKAGGAVKCCGVERWGSVGSGCGTPWTVCVARVRGRFGARDDHHCCGRGALRNKDSRLVVGEAEDVPGLGGACSGMEEREGFEPSVR